MQKSFSFQLAPDQLWQAINPWTFNLQGSNFGLINIDMGSTADPETEQRILDEVGSYGRQLGRIGDVIGILLKHVPLENLSDDEQRAITILKGQLAQVEAVKRKQAA